MPMGAQEEEEDDDDDGDNDDEPGAGKEASFILFFCKKNPIGGIRFPRDSFIEAFVRGEGDEKS